MRFLLPLGATLCVGLWACGGFSSPLTPQTSTPPGAETPCPTLGFDEAAGASVTTYTRCGFTVTATTPNWLVWTPYMVFMSAAGQITTAEIRVTAAAGTFKFQSVDVYSSTTPIPYVITGSLNSTRVFSLQGTQGNTFGNFVTIVNPRPEAFIDARVVRLANPAAPCCENPMGLDNIALK